MLYSIKINGGSDGKAEGSYVDIERTLVRIPVTTLSTYDYAHRT